MDPRDVQLNMANKQIRRHKIKGVGLLEVLITVVLLSIGFLAAARMQVEGLRFSQSAYYQSQAYFLANDMINRMRTNVDGVENGNYDNITTSSTATNPGCADKACTPKEIAQQDVYEWGGYFHARDQNAKNFIPALPSSDTVKASAKVESINDDIWSVQLVWSEIVNGEIKAQTMSVNFALAKISK